MRTWLRVGGLALVALALALDLALLVYEDPANLPGPVGAVAAEYVMPWAHDAVLPLALQLGVVQPVEAGGPEGGEAAEVAATTAPEATAAAALVLPTATSYPTSTPADLKASPTAVPAPTRAPVGDPVRVHAPNIGLDAPVIKVKVDSTGAMGTPRTAGEVGWYGPRPGEQGNALFAGHVDWVVNGQVTKGSFYLLQRLNPGDLISVRTSDNQTLRFRVDWKRYYQAATAPVDEITGPTEQPSITLITCGGPFDRTLRSYAGRWVVRATMLGGNQG